jgi:hypothetical protein
MLHARPLCLISLLTLAAAVLPLPVRSLAHSANHLAAAGTTTSFDTTIAGLTTDKHHRVAVEVQRGDTTQIVLLTITVQSVKAASAGRGIYQFSVPAADLTVTTNARSPSKLTAVLDTHQDLGQYGHISATWTYGVKGTPLQIFDPANCLLGNIALAATITRTDASGSATLNLTFPCEGAIQAQLQGANLAIDRGRALAIASSLDGIPGLGATLSFTLALADYQTSTNQVGVAGVRIKNGPTLLVVLTSSPPTQPGQSTRVPAGIGLVGTIHSAVVTMPADALTNPTAHSTDIVYSGVLGSANLHLAQSGTVFHYRQTVGCLNPEVSETDKGRSVAEQGNSAAVTGSISLAACGTITHTFPSNGSPYAGGVVTTSGPNRAPAVTAVLPASTPVPGIGSGASANVGTGGLAIIGVSPADGATGVSTSPIIRAIFSGTPDPSQVTFLLMESVSPTAMVMLPAPTFNAGSDSSATTPAVALKPNTAYRLVISATNSSGGVAGSISTFTTGN